MVDLAQDVELKDEDRIFYNLLFETYANTPHVDVVKFKRDSLKTFHEKAIEELTDQNCSSASLLFYEILHLIENDGYPDELSLKPEETLCYKLCFVYAFARDNGTISVISNDNEIFSKYCDKINKELMEKYPDNFFTNYLQLLLNYKDKQWAMCLYYCSVLQKCACKVVEEDLQSVQFFNVDLIPELSFDNCYSKVKVLERASVYGYFNFYNGAGVQPDDEILAMLEMQRQIYESKVKSSERFLPDTLRCALHLDRIWKGRQNESPNNDQKYRFLIDDSENLLEDNSENLLIGEVVDKCSQTAPVDYKNKYCQTQGPKCKTVEVQVRDEQENKVLDSIKGIKNSYIKALTTKDEMVKHLHKEISVLLMKLEREEKHRIQQDNKYAKNILNYDEEMKKLRSTINENEAKLRMAEKLVMNLASDKYNLQKCACRDLQSRASLIQNCYNYIITNCFPNEVFTNSICDDSFRLRPTLKTALTNLKKFEETLTEYFEGMRWEQINFDSSQFSRWPYMPDVSLLECEIFDTLKHFLISIVDVKNCTSELRRSNTDQLPGSSRQTRRQSNIERDLAFIMSNRSSASGISAARNIEVIKDEHLLEYIWENCKEDPEEKVIDALMKVAEKYNGNIDNVRKETVLVQVKIALLQAMTLESPFLEEEPKLCSICLEVIFDRNVQKLSCGHEYHRKCISNWLKRNKACPLCRSSVNTEEIPRLR